MCKSPEMLTRSISYHFLGDSLYDCFNKVGKGDTWPDYWKRASFMEKFCGKIFPEQVRGRWWGISKGVTRYSPKEVREMREWEWRNGSRRGGGLFILLVTRGCPLWVVEALWLTHGTERILNSRDPDNGWNPWRPPFQPPPSPLAATTVSRGRERGPSSWSSFVMIIPTLSLPSATPLAWLKTRPLLHHCAPPSWNTLLSPSFPLHLLLSFPVFSPPL